MSLRHTTVYENDKLVATRLPFSEELREHHPNGDFPLVRDPLEAKEALIIGMFVLRPAANASFDGQILDDSGLPTPMLDPSYDWAFNVDGLDGGWIVANGSSVDAYRLGMQYGLSDAVMVGTSTVTAEGIPHGDKPGYLWQPYGPLSWGHVHSVDPEALEKVARQRKAWQELGYLSARQYPAQIVITASGQAREPADFLSFCAFNGHHPNGEPIECYIVTSESGADAIRLRSAQFGLQDRIEGMLIVLPPPAGAPRTEMDLKPLPRLLFEKYDVRIVNHDGGQVVLKDFSRAGVLHQMNITLARKQTLLQVLRSRSDLDPQTVAVVERDFAKKVSFFFDRHNPDARSHGIPASLQVAAVLASEQQDVAVVTFVPPQDPTWWP